MVKLRDLNIGDEVVMTIGSDCLEDGAIRTVKENGGGKYVDCNGSDGEHVGSCHYLQGQEDEAGDLIGVTLNG